MTGDNLEEARARLQKLNVELDEAQQDLKDTEYDKWLSDQEDMLDDLADDMEDFFENMMHDTNAIIAAVEKAINENGAVIVNTLEELGLGDSHSFDTKDNGDDTYTQDYMDYGGNKSSITYDDYGNPASTTSSSDSKYGFKNTEEEIAKFILESFEKAGSNTPLTSSDFVNLALNDEFGLALSKENLSKLYEMLGMTDGMSQKVAMLKLASSGIMNMLSDPMFSSDGKHSEEADSMYAKLSGISHDDIVNARMIHNLMNSSALHKPTKEKEKKRMKTDPLLKYIAENYSGKTLSVANEIKLGEYLGVTVKNADKVTTTEANKILDAFKNAGYSEGGIASVINKAVKANGDDGIATVKKGEAFLTPKQTEAIQDMSRNLVKAESKLTPEQEEYWRSALGLTRAATEMMDNMAKAAQTMEINNNKNVQTTNVDVGGVTVNLEGSHVVDMDSMFQQLQQPRNKQRMTECVFGQVTNPLGNVLSRF